MAFTYFFRDLQTLETISNHVSPSFRGTPHIHIWDAGCAMGPEPYSLAIILRENMGPMAFRNVKIYATDLDSSNQFKDIIGEGLYPPEQVKRIPQDILKKYFDVEAQSGYFRVVSEIRKRVFFQRHDLLSLEPIRKGLKLIMCKNVLLHFKESERIDVVRMFHQVLADDGFFATEQTQKLPEAVSPLFEPLVSNVQLFQKTRP